MRGYKNFESDPHPGDLRHLVEIGYTENRINENGYPDLRFSVNVCDDTLDLLGFRSKRCQEQPQDQH